MSTIQFPRYNGHDARVTMSIGWSPCDGHYIMVTSQWSKYNDHYAILECDAYNAMPTVWCLCSRCNAHDVMPTI